MWAKSSNFAPDFETTQFLLNQTPDIMYYNESQITPDVLPDETEQEGITEDAEQEHVYPEFFY